MWQTKYALAVSKNLGVGVNFRPCSEGYFFSVQGYDLTKIRSPKFLVAKTKRDFIKSLAPAIFVSPGSIISCFSLGSFVGKIIEDC